MELKLFRTDFSQKELENIYQYHREKAGIRIAKKLVNGIYNETLKLQRQPEIGQAEELLINEIEYFEDDILLLMSVSEKDTYKDGVINLKDFKSLYIYSLTKGELKKVGLEGMDVFNFKFLNNEKNLTIHCVDKNNDGQFEEYNEPTLIKKYDFESGKLTDIVDDKINMELQNTLEGTKITHKISGKF